ncbi:hypothetical protein F2Q68_00019667 [Brassica cretica]|uniref:Uncharacterized protein n=1 Tax=Brassica cretica TaxID=69181 RepID=A0A8S9G235_BRACR|nr:hypothetical protein F2Q68_00019667 [Brassica cretica]
MKRSGSVKGVGEPGGISAYVGKARIPHSQTLLRSAPPMGPRIAVWGSSFDAHSRATSAYGKNLVPLFVGLACVIRTGTRGDNKVVLKAHPYALLDASLALQNEYTLSTTMVLIQQPYTPFPSQVQATGRDEALKTPSVHTVLSICQEESDVSSLLDKTTPSQRRVQAAKPTRQKTPHNEIKV